jgi:MinD-like ATPase involved in chromosome partitioning or flagellar assembly
VSVVTAVQGAIEGRIAQILTHTEGIALVRRCADTAELLGVAQAGIGTVAVVGADLPGFDRELVSLLRVQGVEIVALNDPDDQFSCERLRALGITVSVSPTDIDEKLAQTVAEAGARNNAGTVAALGISGATTSDVLRADASQPESSSGQATNGRDTSHGADESVRDQEADDIELTVRRDEVSHARSGDSPASATSSPEDPQPSDHDQALADWSYAAQQLIEETADVLRRESLGILPTRLPGSLPQGFAPDRGVQDGLTSAQEIFAPSGLKSGTPDVPLPPPSQPAAFAPEPSAPEGRSGHHGKIIAVWSGHGAPGRSTIAAGLAYALSRGVTQRTEATGSSAMNMRQTQGAVNQAKRRSRLLGSRRSDAKRYTGEHTILVDADTYAPSLAQGLGLLEESSGLALACRHANQGTLDTATLADSAMNVAENLTLLTGLPRPDRWDEIAHYALEAVYEQVKHDAPWTIVDCAPPLDQDKSIAFDSHAPQRNAATLTTLEYADLVLIVGKADPVGIKRLIDAISQFKERHPDRPYLVVVNQAPLRVTGKDRRSQIVKALRRFADEDAPYFIASDQNIAHSALEWGKAVTEGRTKGDLPSALESLAAMISAGFVTHRTA